MSEVVPQIPAIFYYVIGFLIISNFGSLIGFIVFIFKTGMFVAKTESNIAKAQETAVRAHKRIDGIESRII